MMMDVCKKIAYESHWDSFTRSSQSEGKFPSLRVSFSLWRSSIYGRV